LPYRVFDKIQTVQSAEIVENKRLSKALAVIQEQQAAFPAHKRRLDPKRRQHANNLEKPAVPATTVTFLLCTPGDISTLRGH